MSSSLDYDEFNMEDKYLKVLVVFVYELVYWREF